ncbi:DNA-binding protein, partial [Pseudomonas aeruginosa]|nr:DNA-binding protein [Pseudomonas aeruginosa]
AALPKSLSGFLAKVAQPEASEITRDRLWRITEHCRASVERLFHSLNESPRREHALLPVHAVRELDANSFIKLSNRPGRTIREKLAGNPYIQAVRRFQSVDLPENRLLKAFAIRLAEMLD